MAPKVGENDVALKVGEKAASHLTPLHAPAHIHHPDLHFTRTNFDIPLEFIIFEGTFANIT